MAFEQNKQLQRLTNPLLDAFSSLAGNTAVPRPQQYGQQFPQQQQQNYQEFPIQLRPQRPGVPQMGFAPLQNQNSWQDTFRNFFLGTPERQMYSSPYSQFQGQGFEQLLGMGLQNQQNPYAGWEDLRNSIESDYKQNILPGILEQFTGTGAGLSSPAFAQQVTAGNQGLQSMLLAHKMNLGQQNKQLGLQQAQLGLRPQFENTYLARSPGAIEETYNSGVNAIKSLLPTAARAAASYFTGGLF